MVSTDDDARPDGHTCLARPIPQARTGTKKKIFSFSAHSEQDWQHCPVDLDSAIIIISNNWYIHTSYILLQFSSIPYTLSILYAYCLKLPCVVLCVLSPHLFWTSDLWTRQPGSHNRRKVTKDFSTLPSAVLALIFIARRIQSSLPLVDRKAKFCVYPRNNHLPVLPVRVPSLSRAQRCHGVLWR